MRALTVTLFLALAAFAARADFIYPASQSLNGGVNRIAGATLSNGPGIADVGPRSAFDGASELYVITTIPGASTSCATVTRFANYLSIVRWQRQFCGDNPTFGAAIAGDPDGNMLAVSTVAGQRQVTKLNGTTGETMWQVTTPATSGAHLGLSIGADTAGDARVASVDGGAIKVTRMRGSDGTILATETLAGGLRSELTSAVFDASGNAWVGYWRYASETVREGRLAMVSSNGSLVWESPVAGGAPTMLAIDSDARLIASDGQTVQRRTAFGNTAEWIRPFYATGITTDENGHTIAAGFNADPALSVGDLDMTVVRWDRNGNETWRTTKTYSFWQFLGAKVAVDAAGNALVSSALKPYTADPEFVRGEFFTGADGSDAWGGGSQVSDSFDDMPREMRTSRGHGIYFVEQQYERGTNTPAGVRVLRSINQSFGRVMFANTGRSDDILWQNDDGRVAAWLMEDGVMLSGAGLIGPGTGWVPTNAGLFGLQGGYDIIWQHPDGRVALWQMDGTRQVGGALLLPAGTGWHVSRVADVGEDVKDDLFFEHDDGRAAMWIMDGTRQVGGALLLPAGTGWRLKLTGDFNFDHQLDLVWEHPTKGTGMWLMNGTQPIGGAILSTTMRAFVAGYVTGDSKMDLVMGDDGGGLELWEMDGATPVAKRPLRASGSAPLTKVEFKDIDGDAISDFLLVRADGGVEVIFMGQNRLPRSTATLLAPGSGWTFRRTGAFDSDAQVELLLEKADGSAGFGKWNGAALEITTVFGGGTGWHAVDFQRRTWP